MFKKLSKSTELNRLISREDWKLAKMECHAHPRHARLWTEQPGFFDGKFDSEVLPIHQACGLRPTPEIVQSLVLANPQGVQKRETRFGRTPLHVAVRSMASVGVIGALLTYYPQAAGVQDNVGRVPLHYAISNSCSSDVVRLLLESCEGAAAMADKKGWLPLHCACSFAASVEVVRMLIEACPEAASATTKKGSTPAMCAKMFAGSKNSAEVLALLDGEAGEGDEGDESDPFDSLVKEHQERRRSSLFEGALLAANLRALTVKVTPA